MLTVEDRGARDAFIRKNTCELPLRVFMDHFCVVLHLQLIAGCLGVLIGADTAVGADAELLLGFLGHQIPLGGNNLNLLLGAIGVCGADSVLLSLSVFIAASTGAKWCFLYYFYGRSPPPAA